MIKNQRQYRQSLKQVAEFRSAISRLETEDCPAGIDPVMHAAVISGLKSQLASLEIQIDEFQQLFSGNVDVIKLSGLDMLPLGLIKARIARRMSQKELADLLNVKHQQVQRWENEDYENVGFSRLKQIASVLHLKINEEIILSSGEASGEESREESEQMGHKSRVSASRHTNTRSDSFDFSIYTCLIDSIKSWFSCTLKYQVRTFFNRTSYKPVEHCNVV